MDKKNLEKIKEKLEKQEEEIKTELKKFAEEDKGLKGDWDTRYPRSDSATSGGHYLEDAADEVEQYSNLLPIEHNLELRLKDTETALEKIKKGDYGKCENCGKEIEEERLMVYPEAKTCNKCQK